MNMTDEQLAFAAASFCDRIISNRVWHLPETLETGPAGSTIALRELEHRPDFWRAVTKEATERELRALRTLEMAERPAGRALTIRSPCEAGSSS